MFKTESANEYIRDASFLTEGEKAQVADKLRMAEEMACDWDNDAARERCHMSVTQAIEIATKALARAGWPIDAAKSTSLRNLPWRTHTLAPTALENVLLEVVHKPEQQSKADAISGLSRDGYPIATK